MQWRSGLVGKAQVIMEQLGADWPSTRAGGGRGWNQSLITQDTKSFRASPPPLTDEKRSRSGKHLS